MNDILFDYLDNFYTTYLNDILIYSKDSFQYIEYIKRVLQRLYNISLQANIKKSKFSIIQIKYLSFIILTDSIEINPTKVNII